MIPIKDAPVFYDLRSKLCHMITDKPKNVCGRVENNFPKCDFKKALCMMVLHDCDRGCCSDVQSQDNGVTKTTYFNRGEKTLLDTVPMMVQKQIRQCLKIEDQSTVAWFL